MKKKIEIFGITLFMFIAFSLQLNAQSTNYTAKITVEVKKPIHKVSPTLFGIFFEDINLSADGGIYPELVRNRSFEDADTLQYWKFVSLNGKSSRNIITADVQAKQPIQPLNAFNRKSICIKAGGLFKLMNDGYFGINIVKGNSYTFKLAARATENFNSTLNIAVISTNGKELGSSQVKGFDAEWKYFTTEIKAVESDPKAHLEISSEGTGTLFMDMISLLPVQTWKNHGLRVDLSTALNALNPKFLRFPGGCWVEGDDFAHMNHWKNTIGKIDTRTPLWNIWDYNATNGLGYHEYLQLAEDLNAEPLFCINVGMSHKENVPLDQMGQWIQDAIDAMEYANGPVSSVWGNIRAKNGHPAPFNLKYLEIGNENGGTSYNERFKLIADAVHAKYPEMNIIANDWFGGYPRDPNPKIIDEHYYNNPDWFIWNANKYDTYDRKGPKIFVGEYAVTSGTGEGNLRGAIGEAAWMIGMEKNSDIVIMSSYAPLLCNSNHKRWPINLINFDSHRWYGLPSYYVQEMFANNQGTVTLPVKIDGAPKFKVPYLSGFVGLGTWNNSAEFKDFKVVSPDGNILYQTDFSKNIDDWKKIGPGQWTVQNGVLRQSAMAPNVTAFVGDTSWTDYTVTLKARKLAGENGFQIYYRCRNTRERIRWDLGGYWNTVFMLDMGLETKSMRGSIEINKWYDIKIEIKGTSVKGYIDGKLVQEIGNESTSVNSLFTSAMYDDTSGDIIIKVVNADNHSIVSSINLKDAGLLAAEGKAIVLTSANQLDENSLEEPTKVYPQVEEFKVLDSSINRSFPSNSVTVLRIHAKAKKK